MRTCELTGKRRNVANNVSHAHNKTKKVQLPNLQKKRIWLPDEERFITVKLSTRALRSVSKLGLKGFCRRLGVNYAHFLRNH
jgi:large subunit ribosomal protein L28